MRKKEYPGSFLATSFEEQILAKIEINVDDVRNFFLGIKKREHIDSPVTGASEKPCFELVHEEIPCTTIPSHPSNETNYDVHEPNLAHHGLGFRVQGLVQGLKIPPSPGAKQIPRNPCTTTI